MGIVNIVIIPDNHVRKKTDIQGKLKRAHRVSGRIFFDDITAPLILRSNQIKNRLIDAVIMTFCPGTGRRIAVRTGRKYTDFFLCG